MKSEIRIIKMYLHIAVKRLLYHKANVAMLMLYWAVSLSVLVVFWKVLFQFLPQKMGEWDFPRLAVLNSLCYISWGIFTIFWGFSEVPDMVAGGDLDKYLSRPMSLITGIIGDGFRFESIYEIAAGLISVLIFILKYNLNVKLADVFLSAAVLGLGTAILVMFHGSLALLSFWFGRITNLQQMISQFDEFQRYPIMFFPQGIQSILVYGVPLFFPSTLAAQILLGMSYDKFDLLRLLVMLGIWVGIYHFLYKKCLKRYESHGA